MHIVLGVFIEGETYVMRLQAVIVGVLLISLSRNGKDFSTKKRRPESSSYYRSITIKSIDRFRLRSNHQEFLCFLKLHLIYLRRTNRHLLQTIHFQPLHLIH